MAQHDRAADPARDSASSIGSVVAAHCRRRRKPTSPPCTVAAQIWIGACQPSSHGDHPVLDQFLAKEGIGKLVNETGSSIPSPEVKVSEQREKSK
jgi:hypothetical protein